MVATHSASAIQIKTAAGDLIAVYDRASDSFAIAGDPTAALVKLLRDDLQKYLGPNGFSAK